MEKGILKKIKIAGLAFTVTNKYHTKENQGQYKAR